MPSAHRATRSKHLEIFALLPLRDFGLEAFDLGVLDVDVIVDERGTERLRKNGSSFSAKTASRNVFGNSAACVS